MGHQSIRQEARRAALDAQSKRRRERAEREKRLEGLAVRVLVAIRERDAAVVEADRRAGKALREMTEDEGLSVREAIEWCGGEITLREATRLRRPVEDNGADGYDKNGKLGPAKGGQKRVDLDSSRAAVLEAGHALAHAHPRDGHVLRLP